MKKLILLVLACAMIIGTCACSDTKTPDSQKQTAQNGETPKPTAAELEKIMDMPVYETENFTVTNAMMTYYYLSSVYVFYSQYSSVIPTLGLDIKSPMKAQVQNEGSGEEPLSWYNYFMDTVAESVENFLCYAEAGKASGYEDSELETEVEGRLNDIVAGENMTLDEYATRLFGTGVCGDDIKAALELQSYASGYYKQLQGEIEGAVTIDDINAYHAEHPELVDRVDAYSYKIYIVATDPNNSEEAYNDAQKSANEIIAACNENGTQGFIDWVTEYETEANATLEDPATETELLINIQELTKVGKGIGYEEDDEFSKWAFDAERKAGDAAMFEEEAGSVTVYCIANTAYTPSEITKNFRHILFTPETYGTKDAALTKAGQILAEWEASDKTEATFIDMTDMYNEDPTPYQENVTEGLLETAFDSWIFNKDTKPGDTTIVESDYGYHILYMQGDGLLQWQAECLYDMRNKKVDALTEEYKDTYKTELYSENLDKIPDYAPSTAL